MPSMIRSKVNPGRSDKYMHVWVKRTWYHEFANLIEQLEELNHYYYWIVLFLTGLIPGALNSGWWWLLVLSYVQLKPSATGYIWFFMTFAVMSVLFFWISSLTKILDRIFPLDGFVEIELFYQK